MPPQVNATVTAVVGAGTGDDWDRPAEAGAVKWTAGARVYYRETTDRVRGATGGLDILERRELILDTADVDAMGLDTDDFITFTVDGDASVRTGSAKSIRRARLAGIPRALQTAKVVLEDA